MWFAGVERDQVNVLCREYREPQFRISPLITFFPATIVVTQTLIALQNGEVESLLSLAWVVTLIAQIPLAWVVTLIAHSHPPNSGLPDATKQLIATSFVMPLIM